MIRGRIHPDSPMLVPALHASAGNGPQATGHTASREITDGTSPRVNSPGRIRLDRSSNQAGTRPRPVRQRRIRFGMRQATQRQRACRPGPAVAASLRPWREIFTACTHARARERKRRAAHDGSLAPQCAHLRAICARGIPIKQARKSLWAPHR